MDPGYPIRVAAEKTGMSPHLIRMWERRYSAVKPRRTSTGRRVYSDKDIERLVLLRRATLEGRSISQIADLTPDQLRELFAKSAREPAGIDSDLEHLSIDNHLKLCLQAVRNMDAEGLETRLLRASVNLDKRIFLEELLHPLMVMIGRMWEDGHLQVAHEHLASAVVRSLLGEMYLHNTTGDFAPLLISTSPSGQLHEFGALMASVIAASEGWRTLYLGPNMPTDDIAEAAINRGADTVALSLVYPEDDPDMVRELERLRQLIGTEMQIIAGGQAVATYTDVLDKIGAIRINRLGDLRRELTLLRNRIRAKQ